MTFSVSNLPEPGLSFLQFFFVANNRCHTLSTNWRYVVCHCVPRAVPPSTAPRKKRAQATRRSKRSDNTLNEVVVFGVNRLNVGARDQQSRHREGLVCAITVIATVPHANDHHQRCPLIWAQVSQRASPLPKFFCILSTRRCSQNGVVQSRKLFQTKHSVALTQTQDSGKAVLSSCGGLRRTSLEHCGI